MLRTQNLLQTCSSNIYIDYMVLEISYRTEINGNKLYGLLGVDNMQVWILGAFCIMICKIQKWSSVYKAWKPTA